MTQSVMFAPVEDVVGRGFLIGRRVMFAGEAMHLAVLSHFHIINGWGLYFVLESVQACR